MKKLYILFITLFIIITTSQQAFCGYFEQGKEYYSKSNYTLAESYLRQALTRNPYNTEIRYYMAITLVKNKKFNEAKYHYNYIIKNSSGTKMAHLANVGLRLIDKNHKNTYQSGFSGGYKKSKTIIKMDNNNSIKISNLKINNINAGAFILDTGASYTTIPIKIAKQLGLDLNAAEKIKLVTANGVVYAPKVVLRNVELDGLVARNVVATVIDIAPDGNISGLLGLSFLNNFKVTVNNSNREVILEKP